ncbi:transcriptional repressor TraM [Bradyrhizobium sp.]|uniref:transcriptional repressor TraM n=1 Tax=Bradyrhizobium sp. TaxID=376 RepID=UPI0039E31FEC
MATDQDEPTKTGLDCDLDEIFAAMTQPQLERATVDAVREYRASVAVAETARLQREAAEADPECCPQRRAEIQRLYRHAETEHRARQLVLNRLIERLGYVPKVIDG